MKSRYSFLFVFITLLRKTKKRDKCIVALALVSIVTLASQETFALQVFSVRTATDELVRIDTSTGIISTVGSLGFDAIDVDLATVKGRLFALNSDFGNRVDLYEVNPNSGATIASSQVTHLGVGITSAEGLSHVRGQLVIGFDGASDSASELLGDISLDGRVSNVTTFNLSDLDGLGVDGAGQL